MATSLANTEWPHTPVPEAVKELLGKFFEIADSKSPDGGDRMADEVISKDGKILVNKFVLNGADGILLLPISWPSHADKKLPAEIRASALAFLPGMKGRNHDVVKVYARSGAADDLMVYGTVTWHLDNGKSLGKTLMSRVVVDDVTSSSPRFKVYEGAAVRAHSVRTRIDRAAHTNG